MATRGSVLSPDHEHDLRRRQQCFELVLGLFGLAAGSVVICLGYPTFAGLGIALIGVSGRAAHKALTKLSGGKE
jgi:hypothetical protein